MNVRFSLPACAVVLVSLVAACGDEGGTEDAGVDVIVLDGGNDTTEDVRACIDNLDCAGGEVCRDGECRRFCDVTTPCAEGVCDEVAGACVECVDDETCGDNARCDNNECVFACDEAADCEAGERCDVGSGRCVDAECTEDLDCAGGQVCSDGDCVSIEPQICDPDTSRCDDNVLFECSRDGTVEQSTDCGADALCVTVDDGVAECRPFVCEPNEVGCLDEFSASICDATGTSLEPLPCRAEQYCDAGSCRPQICEPGQAFCEGEVVFECDARGAEVAMTVCAEQAECISALGGCACREGDCVPLACRPGTQRCVGGGYQRCADNGAGYEAVVDCGDVDVCVAGACLPPSCDAGSTVCTGDTLLTCGGDGRTRTPTDCTTTDELCITLDGRSSCGARICEPTTRSCSDDARSVLVCDARGASLSDEECPLGEFCVGGACAEVDCDPRSCEEIGGGVRPDSDSDGIADCIEGLVDTDTDSFADCADSDSDGDGLNDRFEGVVDTDGDELDDYVDTDSDNDGLTDRVEGAEDTDDDGDEDFRDDDSDDDSWGDDFEYGRVPNSGVAAVDTDLDGLADYLDDDSDGDGAWDVDELGCPAGPNRIEADSDDDGDNDGLELAAGSDACDDTEAAADVVDLVVEAPFGGAAVVRRLSYTVATPDVDVITNLDITGSMSDDLAGVKTDWRPNFMQPLQTAFPSTRFALSTFADFPCSTFGNSGDQPFRLRQRGTSNLTAVDTALTAVTIQNGNDVGEAGLFSLVQIALGTGSNECVAGLVPRFDLTTNRVPGVADGGLGGVGIRIGAMPVVLHITDAISHYRGDTTGYPYGPTIAETHTTLRQRNLRVASLFWNISGASSPRTELTEVARATNTVVPACAWGAVGVRPATCSSTQCCTGLDGAGVAAVADACALVSEIAEASTSEATVAQRMIDRAIRYLPFELKPSPRRDEIEFTRTGVDTRQLVANVVAATASLPAGACGFTASTYDSDADGDLDGFRQASPGATVRYDVTIDNDAVAAGDSPRYLRVNIDLVDSTLTIATLAVVVVVPAD